jgi:acyl phosphate:glycerol-3-phosphate acyltransferase
LGVFLVLSPVAVALALAVFIGLMLVWRYVSLGSIMAAAVMPLAVALMGGGKVTFLVTLIIAVVVIAKHHGNIRRLLEGTENRFKA